MRYKAYDYNSLIAMIAIDMPYLEQSNAPGYWQLDNLTLHSNKFSESRFLFLAPRSLKTIIQS